MPGGRIDVESGLRENLAREVMEEAGLTMTEEGAIPSTTD